MKPGEQVRANMAFLFVETFCSGNEIEKRFVGSLRILQCPSHENLAALKLAKDSYYISADLVSFSPNFLTIQILSLLFKNIEMF